MDEDIRTRRRGTETRQRSATVTIRLTPVELGELQTRAERRGLSSASYCREALIGTAGPRAQRRHPANVDELRRLLSAVGKVGANINQLAAAANRGQAPGGDEIVSAASAIREMRSAIMNALGRTP